MSAGRPASTFRVPRIALTGGVASGKSTVARLFTALGAKLIDTDQLARELVAPPSPLLDQIAARFGPQVLSAGGALDRARLRAIVFGDAAARRDLEALMHPAIRAEVTRLSRELGGPYQLVAIPLLVETGTAGDYDRVLLVDTDPELQRRRLMARDGLDVAAADRIMQAQATREQRRAAAHDVIRNDGDVAALASQVETLHRRYQALRSP
ncbi:MAG: dephospho-CoA kinase [Steroidobacteraceae bacterium]